ncbi:hypothetical protein M0805_006366 [Coniferiporia weirii]|nr:hypothetical protein M0805_006366 [Coniferiporia weirii]
MEEDGYDYTDGASAVDIEHAISETQDTRRFRRDSQVGRSYGVPDESNEGAVFDGPVNVAVPSSVSRMSHREMSRERPRYMSGRGSGLSRQRSEDSGLEQRVYGVGQSNEEVPVADMTVETEGEDAEEDFRVVRRRLRQRSPSPEAAQPSVFENIAHLFGRSSTAQEGGTSSRRRSLSFLSTGSSRRSWRHRSNSRSSVAGSDYAVESETDHERWGYSSGEEDDNSSTEDLLRRGHGEADIENPSDIDYGSLPPSPTASLPNMALDPIFGDTRIDVSFSPEPLNPPPPGPPSRQQIFMADEDITVRFIGYEIILWRQWIWRLGCFITIGLLGLLGHWFPRLWLRWVAQEKAFKNSKDGFIVVETPYRDISLFPVKTLHYPYALSTVFPTKSGLENSSNGKMSDMLTFLKVVDYRCLRFALDPRTGLFISVSEWRDMSWTGIPAVQGGLQIVDREQRHKLFGPNVIDIEGKSIIALLIDEIIHPFYVFQVASVILWSLDDYYYYAFCIALISVFSVTSTLIETRKTMARMRKMSRFFCIVSVYSDGSWQEKDSADIVPGDIVSLSKPALSIFPADIFLISGDAIVNESMLTGESVPVSKVPIKDADLAKWKDSSEIISENAKSFLYAGTRVVRIRGSMSADGSIGGPALGLVVRTGFSTTKGSLVRSMLFPKPLGFAFYRDSMRFIAVLAGIAGLGFLISAVQFVRLGVKWHTILIRALDLITVVVPPALPATLSIGTSFALSRLRKSGIFCISPNRVNVSGKVNVCCFDKTGTLTEDGLDILGIRGLERNVHRFGELIEEIHDLPSDAGSGKALFLQALATCHMLQVVDGEVLGDPLDVKMFNFTQWTIEEGQVAGTGVIKDKVSGTRSSAALVQTIVRPPGSGSFRVEDALKGNAKRAHFLELGVIRTFEFVSALRRMSVVVKRLKSSSMEIYVKGAPEVMADICEKDSFPNDYDDLLSYYTRRGYRVIAMAGKSIEGLSWLKAQRLKREQAESGLRFLGLVIFENKVKPGTTPAIQALRAAHMACRMITGDNPLTAVSVARECGLINPAAHVFSPSFVEGNSSTPLSRLSWSCMDDPLWTLDGYSLKPLEPPPHHAMESADEISYQDYTVVITGDIFRWMINYAPLETLQRMLVKTQVFARMSPDEKNEVVERLQALGYTVLMCGDGANDCAALKAADVGLSLSEAEASVAAPFTSRTPDISCVIEVVKEGRAALVTSFSCFKYMALYSLIQFTTITLLYSFASSLGDFQFLYIDLFIIIPIAVTMGRSLPYPRIHPKRPTASLVSKKVLASIIGQILITSTIQFWTFFWVRSQSWYTPPGNNVPSEDGDKLQSTNYENTALFLVSCFQYILVAAVFSIGPPYRKPMWTNGAFMLTIILIALINAWLILLPAQPFVVLLELMRLPFTARLVLLAGVIVNIVFSTVFERWGTASIAGVIGYVTDYLHGKRRVRDGKTYKIVENGMR